MNTQPIATDLFESNPRHSPTKPAHRGRSQLARATLTLLGLVVAVPLLGLAYQFVASQLDQRNYPPPGQLTNVGNHALHLHCLGAGSPTVVFEAGLGGTTLDWALVQPELAAGTRVCAYDRAGLGWSEANPSQPLRTSQQVADELHTLLTNSGLSGPYVLAGLSAGGMHAQMFASRYPESVAGLVLVDPTPAEMMMSLAAAERQAVLPNLDQFRLLRILEPFGAMRLLPLPESAAKLPIEMQQTLRALNARAGVAQSLLTEAAGIEASLAEIAALAPLPADMPITVIWRGIPSEPLALEPLAEASLRQLVGHSDQGQFIIAEGSGHYITFDRPDIVIEAIEALVK